MAAELNVSSDDFHDVLDFDYARCEDPEWEPDPPYSYLDQYKKDPTQWGLDYAEKLISELENGLSFFNTLEASIIERWIFEDHPDLLDVLEVRGLVGVFKHELSRYCRMLSAAATIAFEVEQGRFFPSRAEQPHCDEFFPGVLSTIRERPKHEWKNVLPAPVAELCGMSQRRQQPVRHDSEKSAPQSLIARHDFERWTLEEFRKLQENNAACLVTRDYFPQHLKDKTLERFALVIAARSDLVTKALKQPDRTYLSTRDSGDGPVEWTVSFGCNSLILPLLQHEEMLRDL
ncbi:hypothetical protein WN982_28055 [Paraburkholderia sp. IMGN_8]|uniref:hypothetical protein n=1 Tax=Paraburkholderia sp. IMGN_8 TaxID=3136564 RepID=UPI0031011371